MAYNNEQVQDLFNAAADENLRVKVRSDGILDYSGNHMAALDAVLAVEEADVTFFDVYGDVIGSALILPGLDEGEQIADCTDWVSLWMDENFLHNI